MSVKLNKLFKFTQRHKDTDKESGSNAPCTGMHNPPHLKNDQGINQNGGLNCAISSKSAVSRHKVSLGLKALNPLHDEVSLRHAQNKCTQIYSNI